MGIRVAINGFGRTGRLAFRSAFERGLDLEFVAVNRGDPEKLAHLLKYDSVHGRFPYEVEVGDDGLFVEGQEIKVLYESDAEKLPWKELDVDVVIESSGHYRDRESASKHLTAGAKKVLISAPAKNPDITVVMGVNDDEYDSDVHHIVSNASCTTNCLATVAKVLNDEYNIVNGFMSTIHGYTGTQMILDRVHKDMRRARSAAINIIPTSTGAAKALKDVMPELDGKLDAMAFRVPVPDVSLIDLAVNLEKDVTVEEVNRAYKAASDGSMKGILGYSDEPLVSTDYISCPYSSIVDSLETRTIGKMVKVVAWYDNEWGYSSRLVDLTQKMF
ncbi:type I glyceraldehyde-3-phosphate dehydrogenase [Candidatus Bathyarchaeota archaeon]|nr:type I glyceraldehyde-3-phosphate dehydrogenase [Candidatus Bathyarchaeota archaeon]